MGKDEQLKIPEKLVVQKCSDLKGLKKKALPCLLISVGLFSGLCEERQKRKNGILLGR